MTADIEELARQAIARRADAIGVDQPAWADVVARQPRHAPRARLVLVAAMAALVVIVVAAALTMGRDDNVDPLPPADDSLAPVDHRPTGPVHVLHEEVAPRETWQLVAYPSTLGPCIGVWSTNSDARPATASGFPAASSECALDLARDNVAAFHVAVGQAGFNEAGLRPQAQRLVVGLTADRAKRVTAKVGSIGDFKPVTVYPVPFADKLGAFVIPVESGGDFVDVRVGKQTVTAAWSPDNVIGPGVLIAKAGSTPLLIHDDGEFICVRFRGGSCGRRGTSFILSSSPGEQVHAAGTTELGATAVHMVDEAGLVVASVPTFGCDHGYRVCFYAYSGPVVARAQPVDAAGNPKRIVP